MPYSQAEDIILKMALAAAGCAYAVYGIRLFLRQSAIVFKPARIYSGDPGAVGLDFDEVSLQCSSGAPVYGWWIPGQSGSNVVLFLPGSIGNLSKEMATLAFLVSLGGTVLAIDYPGFGKSGGRASERHCYEAAESAWNFLVARKGVQPRNIVLFGRSVGAAVAAWLAARHECAGLICHSGLTSVPEVAAQRYPWFPARWLCHVRFDLLRLIAACRCPVLVMHSKSDRVISFEHGMRIFERAPSPKCFLPLVGDHYSNEWQFTPGLRGSLKLMIEHGSVEAICDQQYAP